MTTIITLRTEYRNRSNRNCHISHMVALEEWDIFKRRWDVFVSGSGLDPDASSSQLFQCAGDELGDSLLKTDPSIVSKPNSVAMAAMKSLAVVVV